MSKKVQTLLVVEPESTSLAGCWMDGQKRLLCVSGLSSALYVGLDEEHLGALLVPGQKDAPEASIMVK